jgi:hypothetical protein
VQIAPSFTYSSYRQHDTQFFFIDLSNVAVWQLRNGSLLRQPYDDSFYLGALKVTASLGAVDFSAVSSYFHRSDSLVVDVTPDVPPTTVMLWGRAISFRKRPLCRSYVFGPLTLMRRFRGISELFTRRCIFRIRRISREPSVSTRSPGCT